MYDSSASYLSLVQTRTQKIASLHSDINDPFFVEDATLIHSLKHDYETEKQLLEKLLQEIKAKALAFARDIWQAIKHFFISLATTLEEFLGLHGIAAAL